MMTDIRRDVLGRLKTAFAAIDDASHDLHDVIARIGAGQEHEERLRAACAEGRKQIARLEREIERIEIEEAESHE